MKLTHLLSYGSRSPARKGGGVFKMLKMDVVTMPQIDHFRALYVLKYLWEQTDEEHPVTLAHLQNNLSELGINAIPKTI